MTVKTNGTTNYSKTQLTPVSSNVSNWGTTVSYGITGNGFNNFANSSNTWSNAGNNLGYSVNALANSGNAWNNYGNTWGNSGNNWSGSGNAYGNPTTTWGASAVNASNYNGLGASGAYSYSNTANTNAVNNANAVSNYWGNNKFDNSWQYAQAGAMGQYQQSKLVQPSVDISETSSDIVISAYVSNEVANDLSLNVSEDSVTISGSIWTGNDSLLLSRTIPLTTSVRAEACTATLQSGILDIRLPKTEKEYKNKVTLTKDVIE